MLDVALNEVAHEARKRPHARPSGINRGGERRIVFITDGLNAQPDQESCCYCAADKGTPVVAQGLEQKRIIGIISFHHIHQLIGSEVLTDPCWHFRRRLAHGVHISKPTFGPKKNETKCQKSERHIHFPRPLDGARYREATAVHSCAKANTLRVTQGRSAIRSPYIALCRRFHGGPSGDWHQPIIRQPPAASRAICLWRRYGSRPARHNCGFTRTTPRSDMVSLQQTAGCFFLVTLALRGLGPVATQSEPFVREPPRSSSGVVGNCRPHARLTPM
jgi:hypothetical protein